MITEVRHKDVLRAFLTKDVGASVYFIGDLDERYFDLCRWWLHEDKGTPDSLVLLYDHPVYPTILTLGAPSGIGALVDACQSVWPDRFHSHLMPEHVSPFERCYRFSSSTFLRMLQRKSDAPGFLKEGSDSAVRRLEPSDLAQVREVLLDYPENFFTDDSLNSGYYYGLYEGSQLVSMAGVHVVSPECKVAALGNIVTRKACRRRGYSARCTAELLRNLYRVVDVVALNVHADNAPAIAQYERLGFAKYTELQLGYCDKIAAFAGN
ncbi:MAG: GNAT family N-acetyltransferase [FCB group bacterium]|jgi:ribosomal protein S18 acetylase RimI-like enzyme|nr:GNAT family N-acetyltransferase [FCB group bacterium]